MNTTLRAALAVASLAGAYAPLGDASEHPLHQWKRGLMDPPLWRAAHAPRWAWKRGHR